MYQQKNNTFIIKIDYIAIDGDLYYSDLLTEDSKQNYDLGNIAIIALLIFIFKLIFHGIHI